MTQYKNQNNIYNNGRGVCFSCGSGFYLNGWDGLCNSKCYRDITNLLTPSKNTDYLIIEEKLIKYFLKYPDGGSLYLSDKIKKYMENLSKDETEKYLEEIYEQEKKMESTMDMIEYIFEKEKEYIKNFSKEELNDYLTTIFKNKIGENYMDIMTCVIKQEKEYMYKCMYCGDCTENSGWTNLCSGRCYNKLCELKNNYEKGITEILDLRAKKYFNTVPNEGGYYNGSQSYFYY